MLKSVLAALQISRAQAEAPEKLSSSRAGGGFYTGSAGWRERVQTSSIGIDPNRPGTDAFMIIIVDLEFDINWACSR
jgi:hypothetical protein